MSCLRLQDELLQEEGGSDIIATKLKREKLYAAFPDIDASFLDDVFKIHW